MKTKLLVFITLILGTLAAAAETYTYKGYIGNYQVRVTLKTTTGGRGMRSSDNWDNVSGKYTYVKAGNTLNLKGKCYYGMSQTTNLTETTPKGKKSAQWYIEGVPGDDYLTGEFTNLSNGQVYTIELYR